MTRQIPGPNVCPLYDDSCDDGPTRKVCYHGAHLPPPEGHPTETWGCPPGMHLKYQDCVWFSTWYWRRITHIAADIIGERIAEGRKTKGDGRTPLPPKLRFEILHRDGFRCAYCGRSAEDGVKLHVDHRTPVVSGGRDDPENLVTSCDECNYGKGGNEL